LGSVRLPDILSQKQSCLLPRWIFRIFSSPEREESNRFSLITLNVLVHRRQILLLLSSCLAAAECQKLPSAVKVAVWPNFHQLRCSKSIKQTWTHYVAYFPFELHDDSKFVLQLMLDKMTKKIMWK